MERSSDMSLHIRFIMAWEYLRVFGPYPTEKGQLIFRLHDHNDRLFRSAHILNFHIPWAKEEINNAQVEVVKLNNLKEAYLRPMCFYGSGMG